MSRYSFHMTMAVACAMNFDDVGLRREMGLVDAEIKQLKNGYRITTTLEELAKLAFHMTREDGWDMPSQTIRACNHAAIKLRTFIAIQRSNTIADKMRADKDLS